MALTTERKKRYRTCHARLYKLWHEYELGTLGTDAFLRSVASLAGFGPLVEAQPGPADPDNDDLDDPDED